MRANGDDSVDLEMPGPTRRRGKHILDALEKGLIDSSFVDDSARRMLELVYKTGKSQYPDWEESGEVAIDLPEHRVLLRRAGAEGETAQYPCLIAYLCGFRILT